jgi:hypothetical protein
MAHQTTLKKFLSGNRPNDSQQREDEAASVSATDSVSRGKPLWTEINGEKKWD